MVKKKVQPKATEEKKNVAPKAKKAEKKPTTEKVSEVKSEKVENKTASEIDILKQKNEQLTALLQDSNAKNTNLSNKIEKLSKENAELRKEKIALYHKLEEFKAEAKKDKEVFKSMAERLHSVMSEHNEKMVSLREANEDLKEQLAVAKAEIAKPWYKKIFK